FERTFAPCPRSGGPERLEPPDMTESLQGRAVRPQLSRELIVPEDRDHRRDRNGRPQSDPPTECRDGPAERSPPIPSLDRFFIEKGGIEWVDVGLEQARPSRD